jgi:glycolate oxidase iron-sulfur subunit
VRTQIIPAIAETPEGAIADEVLRACVHCGLCNATCPTYQLTGDELDGPRGRIYLIKQVLEGEPAGPLTQLHLDRCLSCRACETTCPSGVEYHRLYEIGRRVVAQSVPRPAAERVTRATLRWALAWPERLKGLLRLGRWFRWAAPKRLAGKILPVRPAQPFERDLPRRAVMLGGCVQAATAGHFNDATQRVLAKAGVATEATGGCCGALSLHLDAPEEARAFATRNIEAWSAALDAGAEAIVVNASGCAAFIRDYADLFAGDPEIQPAAARIAAAVRDPVELLEGAPLTARAPARPRVALHEPCTLQHGLKLPGRIGALLARLGYEPQPVADAHLCCGSAGAYSILQPQFAERLRANKLAALTAGAPAEILTANIGCWMHLGEVSPVPVRHWIEAVDDVLSS